MAVELGPESCPGETVIPPDVVLDDGVTEDEAIAAALWNNASYREMLAQLGISNARLYDAGLLTDPQMTMFFPLGPKQLEFTIFFIVDAVWLRPIRERAASLDLANVSQTMVQSGLNVIRDTRLAHADLLFAQDRAKLADEAVKLQKEIANLASKRFKAGDIAKLELTTAEVESLRAQADAARFAQDVTLAKNRLRTLMGLTLQDVPLSAVDGRPTDLTERQSDDLVNEALAFRPDLRAAEINVQTACERTTLAQGQFMNFDLVYDANSRGRRGFESGPGLRMTLPILNANRGNIAIASEQVRQANRQMITVRDQITLDVRTAYVQMRQASENLKAVREKMLPKLKTAVELARRNYQAGGATYFLVLQTTRQYLDLRVRELELELALRRANAELERSVGHRLNSGDDTSNKRDEGPKPVVVAAPRSKRQPSKPLKVYPSRLQHASANTQPTERRNRNALFTLDVRIDPDYLPGWLRKTVIKKP
ncbi:MAG: TolC family protein [Planctomycetaceae bacterium]